MHTLDVSNLYLEYGFNRVLWDACLHCETGEVVGILGRNGGRKELSDESNLRGIEVEGPIRGY